MVSEFNKTSKDDFRRVIYNEPNIDENINELKFCGKVNKLKIEENIVKADIEITDKDIQQLISQTEYPICSVVWCKLKPKDSYTEIIKSKIKDFYYSNNSAFKE